MMQLSSFLKLVTATALALLTASATSAAEVVRPAENIALGKSYTLSPRPDYRLCTDPGDARQLADGIYTTGYFWTQQSTVGWQHQPVTITLDLGQVEPICGVSFNTAAGAGGVTWPTAIYVLVSEDGKQFQEAGELTAASAAHGLPPNTGYAVHRFWTDTLRVHGRYVMFAVTGSPYIFVDEVEVYRGAPSLMNGAMQGETVTNAADFLRGRQVCAAVARRLRADAQAVLALSTNALVPAETRKQVAAQLAGVEAAIPNLPRHYDETFRAVLPLNAAHEQVFRAQAALWRALGAARLTASPAVPWDPLLLVHAAPAASNASVQVALMQNEFRAGAFNLNNAGNTDETLSLRITGLPGGDNPSWITVHEVEWTDTRPGVPVAAALPEAKREGGAFIIHAKVGLTRQVWLTFHPTDLKPGLHEGKIVLAGREAKLTVPLRVRVFPVRFPDQPMLHLGGWDYTDTVGGFDISPENRPLIVAHLRAHWVDSPWATAAVLPFGTFDAQGRRTTAPDTTRFDEWLGRWPKATRYCVFASVGAQCSGARIGTPDFAARVGAWVRFWAKHAQERGLKPEQLALLLVDEPTQPEQDATILAWANALHAAGTGVKVWEDPIHADPAKANQAMLAACDVLCPNRTKFLAEPKVRTYFTQQRPPAAELAFYSCSGPSTLEDPYTYYRLQAWSCWQLGARSSYFWAFSDAGGGSSWNEYAARGANYVPFFIDRNSVTPGKQMEAIRESAEDYEYLVMLRAQVAAADQRSAHSSALERARKLLTEAAARVCEAQGASALAWMAHKDRTVADQVRLEILETLADPALGGKP